MWRMRWKPSGVQEEAADELVRDEPHELGGAVLAVVFPGQGDVILVAGDEPAVGDGDPMGVAAEIGEYLSWSAEGLLGVDDPVDPPQGGEMAREPVGIGEPREVAEEAQPSFGKGGGEALEEQPSEQAGQRLHGEEEVRLAMDPAGSVHRQSAARDDAVKVRMMGERLPPGVKNHDGADLGAEATRVRGEHRQSLCGGLEQDGVDGGLVLEGDGSDRLRNREDDVRLGIASRKATTSSALNTTGGLRGSRA